MPFLNNLVFLVRIYIEYIKYVIVLLFISNLLFQR